LAQNFAKRTKLLRTECPLLRHTLNCLNPANRVWACNEPALFCPGVNTAQKADDARRRRGSAFYNSLTARSALEDTGRFALGNCVSHALHVVGLYVSRPDAANQRLYVSCNAPLIDL